MQTYRCRVNLAGEIKNQVLKDGIVAAEILLLKAIHGDDAVADIAIDVAKPPKAAEVNLRQYLVDKYEVNPNTTGLVAKTFGPYGAIPQTLPEVTEAVSEDVFA